VLDSETSSLWDKFAGTTPRTESVERLRKPKPSEFTRYFPVARPSGHPASQDVQNSFLTILWSNGVRPKGDGHGRPSTKGRGEGLLSQNVTFTVHQLTPLPHPNFLLNILLRHPQWAGAEGCNQPDFDTFECIDRGTGLSFHPLLRR